MHVGFHTIHYSPLFDGSRPLDEVLGAARRAGFEHVGLDAASIAAYERSGHSLADLASLLQELGLRCTDLIVLSLLADGQRNRQTAEHLARVAATVGSELCVMAVPTGIDWQHLVDTARECASILDDVGVRLAVEFGTYFGVRSVGEAVRVCDAVGWDRAGVLIDSYQFFRCGSPWGDLAQLGPSDIALVQYADARPDAGQDPVDDSRNHRLPPGRGVLALHRFARAIRQTGFDGPVVAEVLSADARVSDPHQFSTELYRVMHADWITSVVAGPSPATGRSGEIGSPGQSSSSSRSS